LVETTVPVCPFTEDTPPANVIAPVEPLNEVTPALFKVIEEPNGTEPPPDSPVPAVTVTEEF
jgi:hypothetical protein